LPTADADGLRAALREQLLAEGILASGKKAEVPAAQSGSFLLWLRMLLVGGGAGGQVLRLGVVAFVAVAGTVEYTTLDSAPMTSARIQDRLAQPRSNSVTQSRRQVAEGVAGNADASLAAEERVLGKQKLESTEGAARLEETAKEDMERAAPPVEATVAMADDSRGDFDEFRDSNAPQHTRSKERHRIRRIGTEHFWHDGRRRNGRLRWPAQDDHAGDGSASGGQVYRRPERQCEHAF
jgi:hypothetical protein